jgi:hypothetical protein
VRRRVFGWPVLAVSASLGLLVALPVTFRDWWLNPGQIFRGPEGTSWDAVLETAWSWFWPVALLAAVLMLGFRAALALRTTR